MINTYSGVHMWLRRNRGSARSHMCPCGSPAMEWAYQGGDPDERICPRTGCAFSVNMNHYAPRCRRCHRCGDFYRDKCPAGHDLVGNNVFLDQGKRKCRKCVNRRNRERRRAHPLTPEQRARKLQLQRERRSGARKAVQSPT